MPDAPDEGTQPIEENFPAPPGGLVPLHARQLRRERTRGRIAAALIGLLIGLAVVGAIGWLLYGDDVERMQTFAVVFSPIAALIGPVLGFYFSSDDH